MVGACTPAAAATARVDTASLPPSARRSAAARTILSLVPSRLPTVTSFMTQMITHFCYQRLRIIGSVVTLAVLATMRGVRVTSTTLPGGTFEYAGDMAVTRVGYGAMQLAGPGVFGPPEDRDAAGAVLREVVRLAPGEISGAVTPAGPRQPPQPRGRYARRREPTSWGVEQPRSRLHRRTVRRARRDATGGSDPEPRRQHRKRRAGRRSAVRSSRRLRAELLQHCQ